jgi:glc operon protein GlcG
MPDVVAISRLTHEGALKVLRAGIQKAEEMGVPQCIAVTDAAGQLLAFVRMDGAKFLSIRTSIRKAQTAASSRQPTGSMDQEHAVKLAFTTGGRLTNLKAGVPIVVGDEVVGAVGVSSGTGEQDLEVALAGIEALADAKRWE